MQVDTWEGEFNGPANPSTVRENIEVRFLFYSVAVGLGDEEEAKEKGEGGRPRGRCCRREDEAHPIL